ncbi:MAG TPA: extensin family protein [Saliniramus sp.]|nr:extensin family protein [Saliniramus sp.]
MHAAEEDEAQTVVGPEEEEVSDDEELVEEELDDEALAAAAALRRPSYDEAQTRICEQELREAGVEFTVVEPVGADEAHCGVERGVRVSAIAGIRLDPALTVRCGAGLALTRWTREVVVPMALFYLDDEPTAIGTSGGYECRWRRGGSNDAAFSQHAFANAIDIASIAFAERPAMQLMPPAQKTDDTELFQAAIRGGACAYFTTVLGPMTNAAHADHLHFDMAERRGGFRLCE